MSLKALLCLACSLLALVPAQAQAGHEAKAKPPSYDWLHQPNRDDSAIGCDAHSTMVGHWKDCDSWVREDQEGGAKCEVAEELSDSP
jgi:hypothetical protein